MIRPNFSYARDFSEGRAFVLSGQGLQKRYCYIDDNGDERLVCLWEYADDFHEGLTYVKNGDEFGFIDNKGKLVIKSIYDDAKNFSEGLAAIKLGNLWGYIDKEERLVITPQFIEAGPFHNSFAIVKTKTNYCVIDKSGRIVVADVSEASQTERRDHVNVDIVKESKEFLELRKKKRHKIIHHLLLVFLAIFASFIEFAVFNDYFRRWGWAFVPCIINIIFVWYRINKVEDVWKTVKNIKYEYAFSFIPLIILNIEAFCFPNGWSFLVLIPTLALSVIIDSFFHDEIL